ncbi:sorting nexin-22 isoform X3 [Chroicocephalus ridibundus]|uniref:sorting nexin-22 isoform X3 n=1 Tax=Chroicocephalus ridibundus TaxID=1192867 RepID=UPI002FDD8425
MIAVSIPAAEPPRSPDTAHTIKKTCKVPDFPPRRVPNWMPKVLEQRRQGLELYIRGVLYHNEELPQDVLDFLKVRRCQQDPKATSPPTGPLPSQRPVVGFCTDPYAQPPGTGSTSSPQPAGVLSTHPAPGAAVGRSPAVKTTSRAAAGAGTGQEK